MSEKLEVIKYLQLEIDRQKEIIRQLDIKNLELITTLKEVREYIETHLDNTFKTEFDYITTNPQELLEILDKENNNV